MRRPALLQQVVVGGVIVAALAYCCLFEIEMLSLVRPDSWELWPQARSSLSQSERVIAVSRGYTARVASRH
jgi:hypothetical protein